jgi:hypothetical protein
MLRKEAERLVGKTVEAWTAMNGVYAGELVELITKPRSPWRAKVRITGVLEVAACTYDRSGRQRWGNRVGDIIEVGNSSVRELRAEEPADLSYLTVLKGTLASWEARVPQYEAEAVTFAAAMAADAGDEWARKHMAATESNLRLARWSVKELARLIEEEPNRLAKMATSKRAATAPKRRSFDFTVPTEKLAAAMLADGIEGNVVTLVNTRGGIVPVECLVSGVRDAEGTTLAAYMFVGGRATALDLAEEALKEA